MTKRRLSLVPRGALRRIARMAVDRSLARSAEGELGDLLAEEMMRAIRREGRSVRGMSRRDVIDELKRSNHALVRARDNARAELEELKRQGALQRRLLAETHDAMVRIADGGAASREQHALDQVAKLFARARHDQPTLDALRVQVDVLVLEAARRERRELLDGLCAERDRQIDVLERRLAKLNRSLEQSEAALRELAARKDVDDGLASVYRTVQGLSDEEPDVLRKRAVLEQVFIANVALRGIRLEPEGAELVPQAVAG